MVANLLLCVCLLASMGYGLFAKPDIPTIVGFPSAPVSEGAFLSLSCVSSPIGGSYDWYKDGNKIKTTSQNYIFRVRKNDTGSYSCLVRNTEGSVSSARKRLVVYFSHTKVMITNNNTSTVKDGELETYSCETDGSNPVTRVWWHQLIGTRWGSAITSGAPGVTSSVRNGAYGGKIRTSDWTIRATKNINGGTVRCMSPYNLGRDDAGNEVVKYADAIMNVTFNATNIRMIQEPTEPIIEGEPITIQCQTDSANPAANVVFYRKRAGGAWEEVTAGVSSIDTDGDYNGNIRTSKMTVKAEMEDDQAEYKCEVETDSATLERKVVVTVFYKAYWHPDFLQNDTMTAATNDPVAFTMHVISKPPPTDVIWYYRDSTTAIGANFQAGRSNETSYALSKAAVRNEDFGNYTAIVTNSVGGALFYFELVRAGPPLPPGCLQISAATAVSVTLTFNSPINGGVTQVFTIECRTLDGNWSDAAKDIAEPPIGKNVTMKVSGLEKDTTYEFRVKGENKYGHGDYGSVLRYHTEGAPFAKLEIMKRPPSDLMASWSALKRPYTKLRIKYCRKDTYICGYHGVANQTTLETRFILNEGNGCLFSLEVFDGDDLVYSSDPVESKIDDPALWFYLSVAAPAALAAIFVVVVVVMYKKKAACFSVKKPQNQCGHYSLQTLAIDDPVYVEMNNSS